MIPRVFISSTYYDLKHVRERLEKFIVSYGFEPVLFESDKITYEHGKPIDHSAYYEVGLCHIMVLIIGGRYGSPSSQTMFEVEKKVYDEEYISITRKELETALQKNIPLLIFIDKNVYAEYQTYKENQDFFEQKQVSSNTQSKGHKFKFAHVDDINVFKFIDIVISNAIKTFEKVEEIEHYLKLQFAGMFYLYLESLKKKSDDKKILDTVSELNNISLRMNEMLNSVGKKILGNSDAEYQQVIETQFKIVLAFFTEKIYNNILFEKEDFSEEEFQNLDKYKVGAIIFQLAIKPERSIVTLFGKGVNETEKKLIKEINEQLFKINPDLKLKRINLLEITPAYHRKVKPLLKEDKDESKVIKAVEEAIIERLDPLPF